MIDENCLRKASTLGLMSHLGVAAGFVVDEAIEKLKLGKLAINLLDETRLRLYFVGLGGMLDKLLSFEQIRANILSTYNGFR